MNERKQAKKAGIKKTDISAAIQKIRQSGRYK
jgi:hypothetical protein